MGANANLHKAKDAKNDEFYTQLNDVSEELRHYKEHFKGKVVFCNCDDPTWSAFWKYFHLNFEVLGLKKLISTHYDREVATYKMEYEGGDDNNIEVGVKTPLEGNGDFRNKECLDLLDECDIVVTNPPFSCYRIFVNTLVEHKKDFVIWSNNNSITYKEIFPLIKNNNMWLGYTANKTLVFRIPDSYTKWDERETQKINDGHHYAKVPAISVFTNLDIKKRHENLILWKKYTPEEYPRYDNYAAVNVDKVSEIPCDYCESWGIAESEFDKISSDWEAVREAVEDGEKIVYVIPKSGTDLRNTLHEHKEGYKEEIEKALEDALADGDGKDAILDGEQQRRCARRRYCNGICGVPITFLDKYSPEQFRIIGHEHDICGNGGAVLNMDNSSQTAEVSTKGSSSIRYCNGVMGVPITFLDKYNPEQFEILELGNSRDNFTPNKDYVNPLKHTKDGKIVNGGAINCVLAIEQDTCPHNVVYYTSDNSKYLVPPYARILIRRKTRS